MVTARTYRSSWGVTSAVASGTTAGCGEPVFVQASYTFAVAENAAVGTVVGTVSATDPNGETVTYSITAGNTGSKFAMGSSTGIITVAASLTGGGGASGQHDDPGSAGPLNLTVQASDGTYTGAAAVTINVSSRCIRRRGGARVQPRPGVRLRGPARPQGQPARYGNAQLERYPGHSQLGRRECQRDQQPRHHAQPSEQEPQRIPLFPRGRPLGACLPESVGQPAV